MKRKTVFKNFYLPLIAILVAITLPIGVLAKGYNYDISYTGGDIANSSNVSKTDDKKNTLSGLKQATYDSASDTFNKTIKVSGDTSESNVYDVVIVMDATSSMSSYTSKINTNLFASMKAVVGDDATLNIGAVASASYTYKQNSDSSVHAFNSAAVLGDETNGLVELTSTNAANLYSTMSTNVTNTGIAKGSLCAGGLGSLLGCPNGIVGTNLESGINAGRRLLATETTAPASHKYLIVITDGGAYAWDGQSKLNQIDSYEKVDAQDSSIATNFWNNSLHTAIGTSEGDDLESQNIESITGTTAGDPDAIGVPGGPVKYTYPTFWDYVTSTSYTTPDGTKSRNFLPTDSIYLQNTLGDFANYANDASGLPNGGDNNPPADVMAPISLEQGDAHAAIAIDNYVKSGEGQLITLGATYDDLLLRNTPIAWQFMDWVESVSNQYYDIEADGIENALANFQATFAKPTTAISKGSTLIDTIGTDFSLAGVNLSDSSNALKLEIAGSEVVIDTATSTDNTVNFGTPNTDGVYPYTAVYYPTGDIAKNIAPKTIVLTINTDVPNTTSLSLSYNLKHKRETADGTYSVPLSEGTTLNYRDSNGNTGILTLPIAHAAYEVKSTINSTNTGNSGTVNSVEKLPNTGDSSMMIAMFFGVVLLISAVSWKMIETRKN